MLNVGRLMWQLPGEGEGSGKEPDGEAGKGTAAAAARRSASEMSIVGCTF